MNELYGDQGHRRHNRASCSQRLLSVPHGRGDPRSPRWPGLRPGFRASDNPVFRKAPAAKRNDNRVQPARHSLTLFNRHDLRCSPPHNNSSFGGRFQQTSKYALNGKQIAAMPTCAVLASFSWLVVPALRNRFPSAQSAAGALPTMCCLTRVRQQSFRSRDFTMWEPRLRLA